MRRCMSCMQEYEEQLAVCPWCGYGEEERGKQLQSCPQALPPEKILMGRYILGCVRKSDAFSHTYVVWDALLEKKVLISEYFPSGCCLRVQGEEEVHVKAQEGINLFEYGRLAFEEESDRLIKNQDVEGIVPVFRHFREAGTSLRVSEYVYKDTMEELLADPQPIPASHAVRMMTNLCRTVDALHERRIFHWNLSPGCILVDDAGNTELTDFGYAKGQMLRLSPAMSACITDYTAPELSDGEEAGGAADLYALGMIGKALFQKTEELPFRRRAKIRKALNCAAHGKAKKRYGSAAMLAGELS